MVSAVAVVYSASASPPRATVPELCSAYVSAIGMFSEEEGLPYVCGSIHRWLDMLLPTNQVEPVVWAANRSF